MPYPQVVANSPPEGVQCNQEDVEGNVVPVLPFSICIVLLDCQSRWQAMLPVNSVQASGQLFHLTSRIFGQVFIADRKLDSAAVDPKASHVQTWSKQ